MENVPESVQINLQPPGKPGGASPAPGPGLDRRDFVLWSLFNSTFCNIFCLGFVALVFSVKARDCKVLGDLEGARRHSARAKLLNIIASVLVTIMAMIIITVVIVLHTSHK